MPFNASDVMSEVKERGEELEHGDRVVPVAAAIIAVFAALATLYSNHSATAALSEKNEAILHQTRSADQYAYYESSRIKVHVYQALLSSSLVTSAGSQKTMNAVIAHEDSKAKKTQKQAADEGNLADEHLRDSEGYMRSYESYEVAATLFEVSIVLVSVTALMGRSRVLLYLGAAGWIVGLVFFIRGFVP